MNEPIREHLEAIDAARDVSRLLRGASTADRTLPAARDWVRRWGPSRTAAIVPDCSCAVGRCGLCN